MSCLDRAGTDTPATGSLVDLNPSQVLPPLTAPAAFEPSSILMGSADIGVGLEGVVGVGIFDITGSILIEVIPGEGEEAEAEGEFASPRFSKSRSRDLITSFPEARPLALPDVGVLARSFISSSIPVREPLELPPDDAAEPLVMSTTSISDPSGILCSHNKIAFKW